MFDRVHVRFLSLTDWLLSVGIPWFTVFGRNGSYATFLLE